MTIFASDGTETTAAPIVDEPVEVVDAETVDIEPESAETAGPAEPLPEIQDGELVTIDAGADGQWKHTEDWGHDWYEYKGDLLAIRVPHQNALTALFQAGESCSPEFQMKLTNKFIERHLSPESRERVLERMSDPDDEEYSKIDGAWNDLLKNIAEIGGKRALKDAEALAAVK